MSFEHKYLKYKQKYLDLKKEVSLLKNQLGGAVPLIDLSAQDPSANRAPYQPLPAPRGNGQFSFPQGASANRAPYQPLPAPRGNGQFVFPQDASVNQDESSLDISALTDTPDVSGQAEQLGGYLMSSESDSEKPKFLNSESEDDHSLDNVDNLTDTPKKHDMVVSINSSDEHEQSMPQEMLESSEDQEQEQEEEVDNEDDSSDKEENIDSEDDSSDNDDEEQEGGDLETSISELEEIFSQLGGKKSKSKKEDSDSDLDSSSMSSLSSLDSSSSDFDL